MAKARWLAINAPGSTRVFFRRFSATVSAEYINPPDLVWVYLLVDLQRRSVYADGPYPSCEVAQRAAEIRARLLRSALSK